MATLAASRRGTRSMAQLEDTDRAIMTYGSSPLSSLKSTPNNSPIKKPESSNTSPKTMSEHEKSKTGSPKIFLRLNLRRPLPEMETTVDQEIRQASSKRKRTSAPEAALPLKSPKLDGPVLNTNPTPSAFLSMNSTAETLASKTTGSEQSTKNASSKTSAPKTKPTKKTATPIKKEFSEASIVAYALREIYNAIPQLPKHKLKLKSVSIEIRREVMELAERYGDFQTSQGNVCLGQIHAIRLDLHLWDDDVPNVCRVQYPFFETVMEKILFWIDRGRMYEVEQASLIKYEEAKAVKSARTGKPMTKEEQMRDSEISSILSELQTLEKEPVVHEDATHHRLRAGILNVANRFCTEQSRVGLDCAKLIEHLKADLHLCPGDFTLMKERKLATLSKPEIEAITRKLPAWFRGEQIYEAGRRAVNLFANSWYEEYSAVHHHMVSLGLFKQ